MEYSITTEVLQNPILVKTNWFTGGISLFYNGNPIDKVSRFAFQLVDEAGETRLITTTRRLGGIDYPKIIIDGKEVIYVRELAIYEKVISFLPFAMVIFGLIGALFGVVTSLFAVKIFRGLENRVGAIFTVLFLYLVSFLIMNEVVYNVLLALE